TLTGSTQFNGMPSDLMWRSADPVMGLVTFGSPIMVNYRTVHLGDSKLASIVGSFPDPMIADYPTAVSCGYCRHALTPQGQLLVAAPDTFYRVSELDGSGAVVRRRRREGVGAGLRSPEDLAALKQRIAA